MWCLWSRSSEIRLILCVVGVDGLRGSEDLADEVGLILFAREGDAGGVEDVLELGDLEGFEGGFHGE